MAPADTDSLPVYKLGRMLVHKKDLNAGGEWCYIKIKSKKMDHGYPELEKKPQELTRNGAEIRRLSEKWQLINPRPSNSTDWSEELQKLAFLKISKKWSTYLRRAP